MTFTSTSFKPLLSLDLQFFSQDTHPFAAEAAPVESHPFAAEPSDSPFAQFTDVPNPLTSNVAPETPQLQPEGQGLGEEPQAQTVEKLDFGGREVEVVDPIIHDLHKDYSNLTRTYQQTNQELLQARQLAEQWQQLAQQQQPAQQPEPPQQNSPSQISQERMTQLNEEYMERMYENKFEADQWWNEQPEIVAQNRERLNAEFQAELNQRLEPIEQEREALRAQQAANEFLQKNPDFEEYKETMQEVLNENPHLEQLPNVLDVLYAMAKVSRTPEVPTFDSMLQDPQYQQQVLANEQIKNMVFQQYQQQKLQTNSELPTIMGSPVGSQTPMSAGEQSPKTLSEATRNWLRSSGQY